MKDFTAAQVMELLEASDAAAFLNRHQRGVVAAVMEGEPRPIDAELAEGLELLAQWEPALIRLRSEPQVAAAWDELVLVAGALVAWQTRMGGQS